MPLALAGLEGKTAVVTGAGRLRGIGRAIALELAKAGCNVVITGTGRDPAIFPDDEKKAGWRDIESVAEEIQAIGRQALPVVSSIADLNSVKSLLDQTLDKFGRVDFLINNAASARGNDRKPVTELDIDVWRNIIDTNVHGTFYMSRTFAKAMQKAGHGGAIINISSIAGKMMWPNTAAYSASKAAIHALTVTMAGEMGQHDIRINAICPGIVKTSRLDDWSDDKWAQVLDMMVPLKRAGTPQEIGTMAAYLCSDQGAWITGQFYSVDGGQAAGR